MARVGATSQDQRLSASAHSEDGELGNDPTLGLGTSPPRCPWSSDCSDRWASTDPRRPCLPGPLCSPTSSTTFRLRVRGTSPPGPCYNVHGRGSCSRPPCYGWTRTSGGWGRETSTIPSSTQLPSLPTWFTTPPAGTTWPTSPTAASTAPWSS